MNNKERAKIAQIIEQGSYFSAMNHTKWRALANAFGDGIRARVKLITKDEVDRWTCMDIAACDKFLDGASYGPVPFIEIEWIDILISYDSPRYNDTMKAIRDLKLPHTDFEDFTRVFGHIAPGISVKYQVEQDASAKH